LRIVYAHIKQSHVNYLGPSNFMHEPDPGAPLRPHKRDGDTEHLMMRLYDIS